MIWTRAPDVKRIRRRVEPDVAGDPAGGGSRVQRLEVGALVDVAALDERAEELRLEGGRCGGQGHGAGEVVIAIERGRRSSLPGRKSIRCGRAPDGSARRLRKERSAQRPRIPREGGPAAPPGPVAGPPPPASAHAPRRGPRHIGGAARHLGQHRVPRHHGRVRQRRRGHSVGHHLQCPHLREPDARARAPRGHRRPQAGVRDRAPLERGGPRIVRARDHLRRSARGPRPAGSGDRVPAELRPRPRDPLVPGTGPEPGARLVHHGLRGRPHARAGDRRRPRRPLGVARRVLVPGAPRAARGRAGRRPGAGPGPCDAGRIIRPSRRGRARRRPRRHPPCPQPGAPLRVGGAPRRGRGRSHGALVRAPRASHRAPGHRRPALSHPPVRGRERRPRAHERRGLHDLPAHSLLSGAGHGGGHGGGGALPRRPRPWG